MLSTAEYCSKYEKQKTQSWLLRQEGQELYVKQVIREKCKAKYNQVLTCLEQIIMWKHLERGRDYIITLGAHEHIGKQ